MEATKSFSTKMSAAFTANTGVSGKLVSANVGFTIGKEYTSTDSVKLNIAKDEKVNLKIYANYLKKSFNVYKNGKLVGSERAWKPYGLVFKQERYRKE